MGGKCIQNAGRKNCNKKDHWKYLGIDERILLKRI
jgi:hypothetical protein